MTDDQRIRRLHNDLKTKLAIDYLHPTVNRGIDHQRFLMNCRDYLTTPREQAIENVVEVLDTFEQRGIMSPGEYGNLRNVVRDLNVEILELIREAEEGIRQIREGGSTQSTEDGENAARKISKLGDACSLYFNFANFGRFNKVRVHATEFLTPFSDGGYTFNARNITVNGGTVTFGHVG